MLALRFFEIFPNEVKAGQNVGAASVKAYAKAYEAQTKRIVRCSLQNLSLDGKMLNVPLFLLDELERMLGLAMGTQKSNHLIVPISCMK